MAKKTALKEYEAKRDLKKTPEPSGAKKPRKRKGKDPIFVIQEHDARRLHYDFRLEVNGVLVSWAVPKGPSVNPDEKRLAMRTEDHPLDYADFEGVIPEGNYGAGTVIVWDTGTYRNLMAEKPKPLTMEESIEKGHIEIWLEGKKLRGGWVLFLMKDRGRGNEWLLKKLKDETAADNVDPLKKNKSVLSGKTLKQMEKSPARTWQSSR